LLSKLNIEFLMDVGIKKSAEFYQIKQKLTIGYSKCTIEYSAFTRFEWIPEGKSMRGHV
jgi:hypothetical protein